MGVHPKKKYCPKCERTKPSNDFYTRGEFLSSYCRECQRGHSNSTKRGLRARLKAIIQEAKHEKPCADCGEKHPYFAMDFDHRDPQQKSFEISKAGARCATEERLLTEIAKCDLVCALCHRYRTNGQRRFATVPGTVAQLVRAHA